MAANDRETVSDEVSHDGSGEVTGAVSGETPDKAADAATGGVTSETPDKVTSGVTSETPDKAADAATGGVTSETPDKMADAATGGVTSETPDKVTSAATGGVTSETPDKAADAATGGVTSETPDKMADAATGGVTSETPDKVTSAATGGVTSETPDKAADAATGGVTSETPDKVTSAATGGVTSETPDKVTSAATGGVTDEVTTGKASVKTSVEDSDEVTRWLAAHAVPLTGGLSAGTPADDLRSLKGVLDGVRIVGLGESTHGTSEFFRLKHRLLEYLVTELGFTTLAMEASASAGPAVDAYVRGGVGDAAQVLTGLGFWTWRTEEVLSMFEWMRVYNAGRPESEQVRFAGIDPQRSGDSLAVLEAFLTSVAPERLPDLHARLGVLATAYPGSRPDPEQRLMREAVNLLEAVREYESTPAGAVAVRHARILVRAADLVTRGGQHADPERTVAAARDRYMAEAVGEILTDPAAKVVLWGHNSHVAKGRSSTEAGAPPLGEHLREGHGDAYYALGLLFGEGTFRAHRLWPGPWSGVGGLTGRTAEGNPLGAPPATSLEARLATATPHDHLLDLRPATAEDAPRAVREWAAATHETREFGALVTRWFYRRETTPVRPSHAYDGLAYVTRSTDSHPIPPYRAPES